MVSDLVSCQICFNSSAVVNEGHGDFADVQCPRCGKFRITGSASAIWEANSPTERQRANAAGWMHERHGLILGSAEVAFLLTVSTPTVAERADKLLTHISQQHKKIGANVVVPLDPLLQAWLSVSWSLDEEEVTYLVRGYLKDGMGWLKSINPAGDLMIITAAGYQHLEEIRRKHVDSNIGFCAMWFGDSVKSLWDNAIEPAIADAGYEPKRIDRHEHNNRIDDEIMVMVRRSKFVVADFTGQRGGVYFEAGFALGLGLQVIWTCKKDELGNNHFDTRQYSFVTWESDKLDDFKIRLQNRIEATIGRGKLI